MEHEIRLRLVIFLKCGGKWHGDYNGNVLTS